MPKVSSPAKYHSKVTPPRHSDPELQSAKFSKEMAKPEDMHVGNLTSQKFISVIEYFSAKPKKIEIREKYVNLIKQLLRLATIVEISRLFILLEKNILRKI